MQALISTILPQHNEIRTTVKKRLNIFHVMALLVLLLPLNSYAEDPTQVSQLEIGGIDNDGTNWWISAAYNGNKKLYKVASDRSTILGLYDLPYNHISQSIIEVACYAGNVYVRIHPSGPIYEVDPSDGSYTTSSYTTRIWNYDAAFQGSTLWQTLGDDIGSNYDIYSSTGTEFDFTEVPGWKSITSDGTYLYLGIYGHDKIYKVTTSGQILDTFPVVQANQPRRISYLSSENAIYSVTRPSTDGISSIIRILDLSTSGIVTLTSPNGAESWEASTTQNITWTSSGVTNVKLEYTTDNGTNWSEIVASTPASVGSYAWTIPIHPSVNCIVRVSDASNASVNDESDNTFTILKSSQALVVDAPETVAQGEPFWVDIKAQDVSNLFGVSFVLSYSQENYIDVVTTEAGDFFGDDIISYIDANESAGEISVGISQKAGQAGVNGSGIVTRVQITTDNSTPDGTVVEFLLNEVVGNDPDGSPLSLTGTGDKTIIHKGIVVWPGDTNNDGTVNQADILPIGLYWHMTGPKRENASSAWTGQLCRPWDPEAAAYADANGKGEVGQADILPIGLNWGKTHSVAKIASQKSGNPAGTIQPVPLAELPISAGEEFWVEIQVNEVNSLFGVSFILTYDNQDLIVPLTVEIRDFLGADGLFFPQVDVDAGEVAVGMSLKSGQPGVDGSGTVAAVKLKALQEITSEKTITFTIYDIEANDPVGENINLTAFDGYIGLATDISESALPKEFALHHNYPNPFNPVTSMQFSLPRDCRVVLKVYNTAGEKVTTLAENFFTAGMHTVDWDASGYSSGIYLYRLEAGDFIETKKLMLLK